MTRTATDTRQSLKQTALTVAGVERAPAAETPEVTGSVVVSADTSTWHEELWAAAVRVARMALAITPATSSTTGTPTADTQRHPIIVAIDGRSGAGKTTLAALVERELPDATVVHLEPMYPGWDGLAVTPALLAAQVLTPLRRGEPAAYRRFDWQTGQFAQICHVPPARYVIVEGVGSSVGIAAPYADVRVWVEAPTSERRRRGLARDGDSYAPHWDRWAAQEDAVFSADDTSSRADLVIRTG